MGWLELHREGCTRVVILIGPYAVKITNPETWRYFLNGLIANSREAMWSTCCEVCSRKFAPVIFKSWGGFLIVQRRAEPFRGAIPEGWFERFTKPAGHNVFAMERKENSFGFLDGCIVAIDYGSDQVW